MFCPECESEYREGIVRCADCDVALVESLDARQPIDDDSLTPLTETRDPLLVEALIERLEAAAVPYVIAAGTGLPLLDDPDAPLEEPQAWEARILVHTPLFERARRIYQQLRPGAP